MIIKPYFIMVKYRNIGRDINSHIKQYRAWETDGYSGLNGVGFNGPKSGKNDLVDITTYIIPNTFNGDFFLPLPEKVETTPYNLPYTVDGASLVINDGYIYLIGGKNSNKILKAHENQPTLFIDTGFVLPEKIHGSSAIIYNNSLYLFGGNIGNNDGYPTRNVYFASFNDLSSWTTNLNVIPIALSYSSIIYYNGLFYLIGGKSSNTKISKNIYISSNLTLWTEYLFLPKELHSVSTVFTGSKLYIFGGEGYNSWSNEIYSINFQTSQFLVEGYLPYKISRAHSFSIADTIYIYCHVNIGANNEPFARILKCDINNLPSFEEVDYFIENNSFNSCFAIINHRLFIFGGSGSKTIQVSDQQIYYSSQDPAVITYNNLLSAIKLATNSLKLASSKINYWLTNY